MKIIDRLFQYLDYKGVKPTRFEKNIGLSNGYLGQQHKRNADLGEGIIKKIIENSLDLSVLWLITGEGDMLLDNSGKPKIHQVENCLFCAEKDRTISAMAATATYMREKIEDQKEIIKDLEKRFSQSA